MLWNFGANNKLEHDCPHSRTNLKENEYHLHHHKKLMKRTWNFEGGFKHNIQQAEEDHIFIAVVNSFIYCDHSNHLLLMIINLKDLEDWFI